MDNVKKAFLAKTPDIVKKLNLRNMDAFVYEDSKSMVEDLLSKIPAGSSITWGGSETLTECGLMAALQDKDYDLMDRSKVAPEAMREFYSKAFLADIFLMSSNAITYDGELVNTDGNGNRLAFMMQGPKEVFIIVGMNKFVHSVEEGIHRIENIAGPANTQRLHRDTPCVLTGRCGHCFGDGSVCSHTVVTRRFGQKNRAKVFIVAENLGY